jgi:SHAQKYF class myb-like DNA-binding protein
LWSDNLHRRFEAAVEKLGLEAAKPDAIGKLIRVNGENEPTRQHIKAHLQKYRARMRKPAASAAVTTASDTTSAADSITSAPAGARLVPATVEAFAVSADDEWLYSEVPVVECVPCRR